MKRRLRMSFLFLQANLQDNAKLHWRKNLNILQKCIKYNLEKFMEYL